MASKSVRRNVGPVGLSDRGALSIMVKSDAARSQAKARREAYLAARSKPAGSAPQRGFLGNAGEAKYIDIAQATYTVDTTGTIFHASIIPQGTSVNQRVGRKCELKYFQLRGSVYNGSTATANTWAIYLVWDQQPNKALAAITDVLDAATSRSLSKRENVQRFKILKKWRGVCCGTGTAITSNLEVSLDEYVRLPKGLVVVPTTGDTTGAIGDVITGALLLIAVGDSGAGTAAAVLSCTCRTGFADV